MAVVQTVEMLTDNAHVHSTSATVVGRWKKDGHGSLWMECEHVIGGAEVEYSEVFDLFGNCQYDIIKWNQIEYEKYSICIQNFDC